MCASIVEVSSLDSLLHDIARMESNQCTRAPFAMHLGMSHALGLMKLCCYVFLRYVCFCEEFHSGHLSVKKVEREHAGFCSEENPLGKSHVSVRVLFAVL